MLVNVSHEPSGLANHAYCKSLKTRHDMLVNIISIVMLLVMVRHVGCIGQHYNHKADMVSSINHGQYNLSRSIVGRVPITINQGPPHMAT